MKTRYLLKKRGSQKGATHPIYVALYDGNETQLIYTGQRLMVSEWNDKERLPKDTSGTVYREIEKVRAAIEKAKLKLELDDLPITHLSVKRAYIERNELKESTQAAKDKKVKEGLTSVKRLAADYLKNNIYGYQHSTQKAITESINAFTEYLNKIGEAKLERKDLNDSTIDGYARYLLEKKKLADSTHGKRMKHLRWFLKTIKYDVREIKMKTGKRTLIHLDLEELKKLQACDVSFDKQLQKAKDMYLLGCFTGQRISDIKRFNKTNTQGGEIKLRQQKTGNDVSIPYGEVVNDILIRNGNRSPRISEGDVNHHIKTVCQKAGINKEIEIEKTKGGKKFTYHIPKYKEITSHTSGKTFASIVAPYIYNLTPAETAAIMGKSLKTLLGYYNKPSTDAARTKILEVESRAKMAIAEPSK